MLQRPMGKELKNKRKEKEKENGKGKGNGVRLGRWRGSEVYHGVCLEAASNVVSADPRCRDSRWALL